jgi:hypothetical protein
MPAVTFGVSLIVDPDCGEPGTVIKICKASMYIYSEEYQAANKDF